MARRRGHWRPRILRQAHEPNSARRLANGLSAEQRPLALTLALTPAITPALTSPLALTPSPSLALPADQLVSLRDGLHADLGERFDCALANLYVEGGEAACAWHRDPEHGDQIDSKAKWARPTYVVSEAPSPPAATLAASQRATSSLRP